MDITIHPAFLPREDPGTPGVCRGTLAFGVCTDVRYGGMCRITAGPAGQRGTLVSGPPVRL